ncbi:RNA dependent RNA polymerase-domain-containing protein [Mycena galopus ATCC 62051]|nr:RNA dependent RNA polymerase-domain-containing protein [Mycena galopus ATCC 62051]
MEHNFDALLDELAPPPDMQRPEKKPREKPAFIIQPHTFSMGSSQGPIFREEFSAVVDHSVVKMYFTEQTIFFKISFDGPFELPVLQATCSIDDLESVSLIKRGPTKPATLRLTLRRPPNIEADFRRSPNAPEGLQIRRATELDWSPYDLQEGRSGSPGTMPRGYWVSTPMKFGLWLTYSFDFFCHRPSDLHRVTVALSRLRTLDRPGTEKIAVNPEEDDVPPQNSGRMNRWIGTDEDVCNIDKLLENYAFDARYLAIGLISQGLILPIELADVIHELWPLASNARVAVLVALFRLERRALIGREAARKQIGNLTRHNSAPEPSLPEGRVYMRRVVVTPTRILLFPASIETSNSVLRAWPVAVRAGYFIRVGFADEDGRLRIDKRISRAAAIDPDGGILARIGNILRNGLYIAGRHYVFLAAGESQLKDHSCWMLHEAGDFTADRVRQHMGDFSEEHVVAKYAARMGLCFSATRHVVDLDEEDIGSLPDIQYGKYTYTDGVGVCSQELVTMSAEMLGSEVKAPSAFQFRMGGNKGVCSVRVDLEGNQIGIRPSMQKFRSPLKGLGVMKVSRFAPAHLNRQAICIMSALGTNRLALLSMFKQQIHYANNIEIQPHTLNTTRYPAKPIFKNAFIPVAMMIKAGLVDQLLLKNVLKCIKCQLLRDLKYKARVLVPDGAYLMGIADEYGILEEGQIYCAITPAGPHSRRVITGQCTIFRSPCIHPGDVRLVTAVDHPVFEELQLTNVVVFSTKKSERDLPSMLPCRLGGGDLDGDCYTVIYDKELQITRVHEPMDYSPAPPKQKEKVEMSDVIDFVVEFFRNDVIGLVATNFEAIADRFGPEHPDCLELAQLHSDAVDFAKSGRPVVIPDRLRPVLYPDFMGRDSDYSYLSPRVLGVMYRLIEPAPEYHPSSEICIDTRITSRRIGQMYLQEAGKMKQKYDVDLEGIMRQYSLCEAEIIAGVSIMSDRKRRRAADDAIRGPVREAMESLFTRYRREGRRFVKENRSSNGLADWAIACYQVTHVQEYRSRWVDSWNHSRRGSTAVSDDGSEDGEYSEVMRRELISFPWLWAHEICNALEDAVIKEEDEEDEELGWRHPWHNESDPEEDNK